MIGLSGLFQNIDEQKTKSESRPIPAQRRKLGNVSDEDRETLKKFILTTIDLKLREALQKLSIDTNKNYSNEDSLDSELTRDELNSLSNSDKSSVTENISIPELGEIENKALNGSEKTRQFIDTDRSQTKGADYDLKNLSLKFDNQFECSICCEKYELINSESFGCSHMFCKKCLCQYLTTSIADGRTDSLKCPQSDCDTEASEKCVEKLVPFQVFQRYYELRLKKAVGKMDDIFYCPNTGCEAIVPCEIDVGLGVCYECNFNFCTNCLKPFHGTIDCHLNEDERHEMLIRYQSQERALNEETARNLRIAEEQRKAAELNKKKRLDQERATETFIKRTFKRCPGCPSDVEKLEGCNHMVCTVCHTHFCWLCLTKFAKDKDMKTHFTKKCLLFEYDFVK